MVINILGARNPVWADSDHIGIELEVNFEHLRDEWVPFHATEDDDEEHGRYLHAQAELGAYGPIGPYVNNG